jgi:hypothetical protein
MLKKEENIWLTVAGVVAGALTGYTMKRCCKGTGTKDMKTSHVHTHYVHGCSILHLHAEEGDEIHWEPWADEDAPFTITFTGSDGGPFTSNPIRYDPNKGAAIGIVKKNLPKKGEIKSFQYTITCGKHNPSVQVFTQHVGRCPAC